MNWARAELPEGWKWVKLGDVCQVFSGSTPKTSVARYWNGDIIWATPKDLGKLTTDTISDSERKITKAGYESANTTIVPTGAVVMSSRAPIGHLAITGVPLCTNQGCKSFVPSEAIDSHFLYLALKNAVPELQGMGSGATFAEISKSKLEMYEIPLPPMGEQKFIAQIIKTQMAEVAKARTATEAQLEAINALPASLLREAFSGRLSYQPSPDELRAALACLAIDSLHYRRAFGAIQLMKLLFFAQVHYGIPLAYHFTRYTYGPFDKAVYELEEQGKEEGWFQVDESEDKDASRYIPGDELPAQVERAKQVMGKWSGEIEKLFKVAESFDTRGLELLATLYAAWNDLLLEGEQPTDQAIFAEVERWPEKAGKFKPFELKSHLNYLREEGLTPKGAGQSTKAQPQSVKVRGVAHIT